ncbi:hypothetical protein F4779DRAFT_143280 [Xylariaceae sp. FL0662B]|nr:hypothetical protein F4779DRAFT_143280 [Xylariaceae sp. FL0662B]
MPPLLPRPSLLPRAAAAPSLSRAAAVFFSTTPATARGVQIPPESPSFINVPNPPQDQSIEALRELKPIKGHLPVPRPVFARRDSHLKATDEWLSRTAPEPSSARSARPPHTEIQAWKRRMAASRRANIRSGVRDLWARKQRFDRTRLARQTARLDANRAAAMAPERDDDVLTRSSISPGTLQTTVQLDPERFERALASRTRTAAIAHEKSEARRDAIQELYMKARSFIVSEDELQAEVDRLFSPDYWKNMGQSAAGAPIFNIWDMEGRQVAVKDLMDDVSRSSSLVVKNIESERTRTLKRQKEVAEELTGGKMDSV